MARSIRGGRLVVAGLSVALIAVACGEGGLLDGVGDRSREAVYEGITTTTEYVEGLDEDIGVLGASDAREIEWYNDTIEEQSVGAAQLTIATVWNRRTSSSRFIQASRAEIASALPQIQFPRLVPPEVVNVTSQLVFDQASGTLDQETSAAFGLWPVAPYTVEDGQSAVLRVGMDQGTIPQGDVVLDVVGLGISLEWVQDGYRYELFCAETLDDGLCQQMVESMEPLATIAPRE